MDDATHKGADLKVLLRAVFAGVALATSVLVVTGIFDRSERQLNLEEAQHNASVFANTLHTALVNSIHDRTVVVENVRAFWRASPQGLDKSEFARYGRAILSGGGDTAHTGVRAVQLVKDNIVRYVYPRIGNAAMVGRKVRFSDNPGTGASRDAVVLFASIGRERNSAKNVLIARMALHVSAKGVPRLWGYALAIIDLKPILREFGARLKGSGYDVAIRSLNDDGTAKNIFFGKQSAFVDDGVVTRVELSGLSWQIGLRPVAGWPSVALLTPWFWLTGGVLAVLSGFLLAKQIVDNANLRAARYGAEKASRAKSAFLANMSHEFRTPLNAVIGYGDMLAHDLKGPLNAGQREYLGHISDSAHHLLKLISQVLELSKIETGTLEVNSQALCVDETVAAAMSFVTAQAAQKKVVVKMVQGCGAHKTVWADKQLLRRVLINLLGNAVKYNRQGGWVEISCAPLDSGYTRVSVRDSGLGIPLRRQKHLFAPFERLAYDRSELEGAGIGLTITKNLVETMGGQIGFETQEGIGSTFWVEFPGAA